MSDNLEWSRTFRRVLASTVSFFLLAIMAIVLGFTRGHGFVPPSFESSPPAVLLVYGVGLGFPAFSAFCLLVAWVRLSEKRYGVAQRLALAPWGYFAVFMTLLALLLRR